MSMHISPHPGAVHTIKNYKSKVASFSMPAEQAMVRCNTVQFRDYFSDSAAIHTSSQLRFICTFVIAHLSLFLYASIKSLHFATVLKTSTSQEKGAVTQQQTFRVLTCMNELQNQDSPTKPSPRLPSHQD